LIYSVAQGAENVHVYHHGTELGEENPYVVEAEPLNGSLSALDFGRGEKAHIALIIWVYPALFHWLVVRI